MQGIPGEGLSAMGVGILGTPPSSLLIFIQLTDIGGNRVKTKNSRMFISEAHSL